MWMFLLYDIDIMKVLKGANVACQATLPTTCPHSLQYIHACQSSDQFPANKTIMGGHYVTWPVTFRWSTMRSRGAL